RTLLRRARLGRGRRADRRAAARPAPLPLTGLPSHLPARTGRFGGRGRPGRAEGDPDTASALAGLLGDQRGRSLQDAPAMSPWTKWLRRTASIRATGHRPVERVPNLPILAPARR